MMFRRLAPPWPRGQVPPMRHLLVWPSVRFCGTATVELGTTTAAHPTTTQNVKTVVVWTKTVVEINNLLKRTNNNSASTVAPDVVTDAFDTFVEYCDSEQHHETVTPAPQQKLMARQAVEILSMTFMFRKSVQQPSPKTLLNVQHACLNQIGSTPSEVVNVAEIVHPMKVARALAVVAEPHIVDTPLRRAGLERLLELAETLKVMSTPINALLVVPRLCQLLENGQVTTTTDLKFLTTLVTVLSTGWATVEKEGLTKMPQLNHALALALVKGMRATNRLRIGLLADPATANVATRLPLLFKAKLLSRVVEAAAHALNSKRKTKADGIDFLLEAAGLLQDLTDFSGGRTASKDDVTLSKVALQVINTFASAHVGSCRSSQVSAVSKAYVTLGLNLTALKDRIVRLATVSTLSELIALLSACSSAGQQLASAQPVLLVAVSRHLSGVSSFEELARIADTPGTDSLMKLIQRRAIELMPSNLDDVDRWPEAQLEGSVAALCRLLHKLPANSSVPSPSAQSSSGAASTAADKTDIAGIPAERVTPLFVAAAQGVMARAVPLSSYSALLSMIAANGVSPTAPAVVQRFSQLSAVKQRDDVICADLPPATLASAAVKVGSVELCRVVVSQLVRICSEGSAAPSEPLTVATVTRFSKSFFASGRDALCVVECVALAWKDAQPEATALYEALFHGIARRCYIDKHAAALGYSCAWFIDAIIKGQRPLSSDEKDFCAVALARCCGMLNDAVVGPSISPKDKIACVMSACVSAHRADLTTDVRVEQSINNAAEACVGCLEDNDAIRYIQCLSLLPSTWLTIAKAAIPMFRSAPSDRAREEELTVVMNIISNMGPKCVNRNWKSLSIFAEEVAWSLHRPYTTRFLCALLRLMPQCHPVGWDLMEDRIGAYVLSKQLDLSAEDVFNCLDGSRHAPRQQGFMVRCLRQRVLKILEEAQTTGNTRVAQMLAPVLSYCYPGDEALWRVVRQTWPDRSLPSDVAGELHSAGLPELT